MATTVTSKGQVTIPKPVRDHLGITPGSRVEFRRAADWPVRPSRSIAVPGVFAPACYPIFSSVPMPRLKNCRC
jgi:AbrB family looped-hinge helix DNA binding protein